MKIISPDNNCSGHFHLENCASKQTSTNAHITSEWTFFVNVSAFNGFFRGLKPKSNIPYISQRFLLLLDSFQGFLPVQENSRLLLKWSFKKKMSRSLETCLPQADTHLKLNSKFGCICHPSMKFGWNCTTDALTRNNHFFFFFISLLIKHSRSTISVFCWIFWKLIVGSILPCKFILLQKPKEICSYNMISENVKKIFFFNS